MHKLEIDGAECPCCGYKFSGKFFSKDSPPHPSLEDKKITICVKCAELLMIDGDNKIQKADETDIAYIRKQKDGEALMRQIRYFQSIIKSVDSGGYECPHCKEKLMGHECLNNPDNVTPEEGDLSLCSSCGKELIVGKTGRLEAISPEVIEQIKQERPEQYALIEEAKQQFRDGKLKPPKLPKEAVKSKPKDIKTLFKQIVDGMGMEGDKAVKHVSESVLEFVAACHDEDAVFPNDLLSVLPHKQAWQIVLAAIAGELYKSVNGFPPNATFELNRGEDGRTVATVASKDTPEMLALRKNMRELSFEVGKGNANPDKILGLCDKIFSYCDDELNFIPDDVLGAMNNTARQCSLIAFVGELKRVYSKKKIIGDKHEPIVGGDKTETLSETKETDGGKPELKEPEPQQDKANMGYYIETNGHNKKAQWIVEHAKGEVVGKGNVPVIASHDMIPVVVVDNGAFEAAGIAFDTNELKAFVGNPSDKREKTILLVPRAEIIRLCPKVEPHLKWD